MCLIACGSPNTLLAGILYWISGYPSKQNSFSQNRVTFQPSKEETSEEEGVKTLFFHLFFSLIGGRNEQN